MWNTTDTTPDPRSHIIALTTDGGSAVPLYVHPVRGFVTAEGEVHDSNFLLEHCQYWTYAPEGYTWWIERGDDGQDLDGINTDAVLADDNTAPIAVLEEPTVEPEAATE